MTTLTSAKKNSLQKDITFPVPEDKSEIQDFIKVPLNFSFSNNTIFVGILYNVSSRRYYIYKFIISIIYPL
jgi:hypothetical protein